MRFNAKKCYILSLKKKGNSFYNLYGHILQLQEVTSNPYLGLQISEDLKWKEHISNTANKANATLGPIYNNRYKQTWNIQRRGARFITKDYKSREEGCLTEMLKELELPSLETRRKQQRLIFLYKVVWYQLFPLRTIFNPTELSVKSGQRNLTTSNLPTLSQIRNDQTVNLS